MTVELKLVSDLAGTLKSAADIAKTVKDTSDMPTIKGKIIEMQDLILNAQSSTMAASSHLFELLNENAELRRKVSAVDEWRSIADRYALKDYGGGTFAYELRPEVANGEPTHRICPACFENSKRSVLQFQGQTASRQAFFKCMPCGHDYFFGTRDTSSWNNRRQHSSDF